MDNRKNSGISEIIGSILLLLIAVSIFSFVYLNVLNSQEVSESTITNIVATVEGEYIILEHRGGEPIDIDATLSYTLNQTSHSFLISDFLEPKAKLDNIWNLGERCYIPFEYDLGYLEYYDTVEVTASDVQSNNLIFTGTLDLHPMSDLGIEVSFHPVEPLIGQSVTITINASCRGGDVGAREVKVRCNLPNGLVYLGHTATKGSYTNSTGIWYVDKIDVGESEILNIEAQVTLIEKHPFAQLAVVLDGSGSISSHDWEVMKEGLANAVSNQSVFPRDESVELTVVQFGDVSPPKAQVEISPTIIDGTNYQNIANDIRNIPQMVNVYHNGATPTACGLRLAADKIKGSTMYDSDNRSIVILVTDGKANCEWTHDYEGVWDGNGWIQSTTRSHSGSSSATATYNNNGAFISKSFDTSNSSTINVDFWYRLDDTESWDDDLDLYYYDGTTYDYIDSLGGETENNWLHYQDTINDPQYYNSNFNIKFYSKLYYGENIWIDDVSIDTGNILFTDSFESSSWNMHWTNPGKLSAEQAREYMLSLLNMNESQDEFDCLAVGSGPELYWLNHSMTWPQPGYNAPPYNQGSGWYSHISGFSEFEIAINEIFKTIFEGRLTPVKIEQLDPIDPNQYNDDIQITIVPKD